VAGISGNEIVKGSFPAPTATASSVESMPPSIANLIELASPSPRNTPVQAYAKLEFGAYSFYVQSLSVTLGRKAAETDPVDVHLGNTKAISREHARVQYSFARNSFEIHVCGRNGLFVDDVFYDQGSVVALDDR
jgi:FHA domain